MRPLIGEPTGGSYFNRTLEEIGKRNVAQPQVPSNFNHWDGSNRGYIPKNIDINEMRNINEMRGSNYMLNHRMWKLNNKKKKMKQLSDFEVRLEMTLQKKKLKKKELEKKYYDYNFKPNTNKKRIKIYNKAKTARADLGRQKKKSKNLRHSKLPAKKRNPHPKKQIKRKFDDDSYGERVIGADELINQASDEIEELKQHLEGNTMAPKFKRFISKHKSYGKEPKIRKVVEKHPGWGEDVISMDSEDDIPDQLNDSDLKRV